MLCAPVLVRGGAVGCVSAACVCWLSGCVGATSGVFRLGEQDVSRFSAFSAVSVGTWLAWGAPGLCCYDVPD